MAETYANALLEVLVHSNLSHPPRNHRVVRVEIPESLAIEMVAPADMPGWDTENAIASRVFGDEWVRSQRTAVLRVPSVVTHGREHNLVLNAEYPGFHTMHAGAPETVQWDAASFPGFGSRRKVAGECSLIQFFARHNPTNPIASTIG